LRALLARLAALCNEQTPNSVTPYGGQGQFSPGTSPPAVFRVAFINTAAEQKLELTNETGLAAESYSPKEPRENSAICSRLRPTQLPLSWPCHSSCRTR
jgi:hypothetical protein